MPRQTLGGTAETGTSEAARWSRRSRYLIVVGTSLRSRTPAKTAKPEHSLIVHPPC